jgi:hypothetical protein
VASTVVARRSGGGPSCELKCADYIHLEMEPPAEEIFRPRNSSRNLPYSLHDMVFLDVVNGRLKVIITTTTLGRL